MATYGVDVLDPAVSTRRVAVLLDRLPPDALAQGEVWSAEAHLLAALIDQVGMLTWVTLRAHGAKNAARPRPVPRPEVRNANRVTPRAPRPDPPRDPGTTKTSSWAEAFAVLAGVPGVKVERRGG
jgi:hypothetical protein